MLTTIDQKLVTCNVTILTAASISLPHTGSHNPGQIVQTRCLSAWKTRHLSIPPTFLLSLLSFPDTSSLDALAKYGKGVEMYQNIIMHGKRRPPNLVL